MTKQETQRLLEALATAVRDNTKAHWIEQNLTRSEITSLRIKAEVAEDGESLNLSLGTGQPSLQAMVSEIYVSINFQSESSWPRRHYPIETLLSELKKSPHFQDHPETFEFNGWSYDWTREVSFGDQRSVLAGSGFHGGLSIWPVEP